VTRLDHLVIRADASSRAGTGHVMRCIALAQHWQGSGKKVTFLSHQPGTSLRQRIASAGIDLVPLEETHPHETDLATTCSLLQKLDSPCLAVDGYHFDSEYQQAVRQAGHRLLVIDDTAHLPSYHADKLLNQNIHAQQLAYAVDDDTELLLGPRYALLRPEFLSWKDWQRETPKVAHRILVTMGGSDPDNATLKVIQALRETRLPSLEAKVVVGPANSHLKAISEAAGGSDGSIQVLENVSDMPSLMAWADMAVSAGGSTCGELAFMGLPALLLVLAENQVDVTAGLHRAGSAIDLGNQTLVTSEELADAIALMLNDEPQRHSMTKSGRALVDGLGANRVVQTVSSGGDKGVSVDNLILRPVVYEDWEMLLSWRNDPITVANSTQSRAVPADEHRIWLKGKLANPKCAMYVAEVGKRPVGHLRFDIGFDTEGKYAEVSVVIAPGARGQGRGTELLRKGCLEAVAHRYIAFIKPENQASVRAFFKAGFSHAGQETRRGVLLDRMEHYSLTNTGRPNLGVGRITGSSSPGAGE